MLKNMRKLSEQVSTCQVFQKPLSCCTVTPLAIEIKLNLIGLLWIRLGEVGIISKNIHNNYLLHSSESLRAHII